MELSRSTRWDLGALLVAALLGAWLVRPGAALAVAALVPAIALALAAAWRAKPWPLAAASLAVAAAGAGLISARQVERITRHWSEVRESRIEAASVRLSATLADAVRTARDLATLGAALGDVTQEQAFERLGRATATAGPERGVVIRDSLGQPWAWAGRQRLGPAPSRAAGDLQARITPFYVVLEARRQAKGRSIVAHVLLSADTAVTDAGQTVAARFLRENGARLEFLAPRTAPPANDVFDYCLPACGAAGGADTLFSVRTAQPDPADAAQAAALSGARNVAWLALAFLGALLLAGGGVARCGVPVLLAALGALTPLARRLGLELLFGGAAFSRPSVPSAGALLVVAALALLVAARARRVPVGRRAARLTLATLLVVLAAPLLAWLAGGIHVPRLGATLADWFAWQVTLGLTTAGLVTWAGVLLGDDEGAGAARWAAAAVTIAVAAGLLGLWLWTPEGLPDWYWVVWIPAFVASLRAGRWRRRLVAAGLVTGAAAAIATWNAVALGRIQLAALDAARLGPSGGDAVATSLLEHFGAELAQGAPPRSEAELYARWVRSPIASEHYPVKLVTWGANDVITGELDLAELDLPAPLLKALALNARSAGIPLVEPLTRVPGLHYVLAVPFSDGEVVTVGVGPRSRLIRPARPSALLRGAGTNTPPYEMSLSVPQSGDVPATLRWTREGWSVRGEERLDFPGSDGARHLHVLVTLTGTAGTLARGVLFMLLDATLLALLWITGNAWARRAFPFAWSRRPSYRAQLTAVLAVFFVAPTVAFAGWTAVRSRAESRAARDLAIRQTLHDAENEARRMLLERPEVADRDIDQLAASFGADLHIFQGGVLWQTSADALAELGMMDYYLPPDAYRALALEDRLEESADAELAGRPVRVGYQTLAEFPDGPAVLAVARSLADPTRSPADQDVVYGLLLTTLVGLFAAWGLATIAAHRLARPVRALREAAAQVGRGEPVAPLAAHVPVEFVPVADAFQRMAQAVRVLAWGELARQIAHEIKNPLTPIRLGIQHLTRARHDNRPDFDAQLEKTSRQILSEIERLDTIARAFARFGAPAAEAGPLIATNATEVARDTAQLYALGGRVTVTVSGDGPAVRARKDELREVLINLIENARDAGARAVSVRVERGAIVVQDDGRGIPADDLSRIFEPRFSTTTSGTGLGLAICKRLVEGWGGRIEVESTVGKGTVVSLRLLEA